jgi:ABC-type hemin transport system ATPase subunit
VCINTSVIADGAPIDVLNSEVLEKTYGAPMEVLIHGGMPIVLDNGGDNLARRLGELGEVQK